MICPGHRWTVSRRPLRPLASPIQRPHPACSRRPCPRRTSIRRAAPRSSPEPELTAARTSAHRAPFGPPSGAGGMSPAALPARRCRSQYTGSIELPLPGHGPFDGRRQARAVEPTPSKHALSCSPLGALLHAPAAVTLSKHVTPARLSPRVSGWSAKQAGHFAKISLTSKH